MRAIGLIGVLAGMAAAALYLVGVTETAGPLLIGLAPFPLFAAALGWGGAAGLMAGGTAVLAVLLASALMPGTEPAMAIARAIALTVTTAAPALWLSRLALLRRQIEAGNPESPLEWYPPGRLLLWLAGLACAGFLALELLARAAAGVSPPALIASYFDQQFPAEARQALVSQMKAPDWKTLIGLLAAMMPAIGGVFWQLWIAANGIGAFSVLSGSGRGIRSASDWRTLSLPRPYAVMVLLLLLVGIVSAPIRYWTLTLAALLSVPYFFLGLSVVHAIPLRGPGRLALLGLFYFLLLLQVWPAALVVILGFAEQWSGMRARLLARPGRSGRKD